MLTTARVLVLALVAGVLFSVVSAPAAEGAETRPNYVKPTGHSFVSMRCVETAPDTWRMTATWRVTGGRYTNLGNPNNEPRFNDRVWRGGSRLVKSQATWYGWPGTGPSETTTAPFTFQHMTAPIRGARDVTRWRLASDEPTVTFTC